MTFFSKLVALFRGTPPQSPRRATHLLFVKVPEQLSVHERVSKYEDPLEKILAKADLGEISGGGTMQDKNGTILWVGIDVDVYEPEKALPVVIQALRDLGAPDETVIEYGDPKKSIQIRRHPLNA